MLRINRKSLLIAAVCIMLPAYLAIIEVHAEVIILTPASPEATITEAASPVRVYGTAGANHITVESGADATLVNFPGSNTITINADSNLFTVLRSGATVIFEGTDGTVVKIPATQTSQTIAFDDSSLTLIIDSGDVMIGSQIIGISPAAVKGSYLAENNNVVVDLAESIVQPEKIISFSEDLIEQGQTSKATVFQDGYTSVFAIDGNDNIVGMAFSDADDSIEINVDSTLKAIVMSFPVKWGEYDLTVPEILSLIEESPEYSTLKSHITDVMRNDPENLLSSRHPEIWTSAYSIVKYIIENAEPAQRINIYEKSSDQRVSSVRGSFFDDPAYVTKGSKSVVKIKNPRHVPYGISSMNINTGYVDFVKRPFFAPWKDFFGFFTGDTEINYNLGGYGNYLICLSKQSLKDNILNFITIGGTVPDLQDSKVNFSPIGQMEVLSVLKGIIGWNVELIIQAVNLVPGAGDFISVCADIATQMANDPALDININDVGELLSSDGNEYTTANMAVDKSLDVLIAHAYKAKSLMRRVCKYFTGSADNAHLASFLKKVACGRKIANAILMIPEIAQDLAFFYDTANAQDSATYIVSIDSSGNQTIKNYDPPTVEITSPEISSISIESGDKIDFAGKASKDGKSILSDNLQWSSNIDGVLGKGAGISTNTLSEGTHVIVLQATAPDKTIGTAYQKVIVKPSNHSNPVVTIIKPLSNAVFSPRDTITLECLAYDWQNNNIINVSWYYLVNGISVFIGTGSTITTNNIPFGLNSVEAVAIDKYGVSGKSSVQITVESLNPVSTSSKVPDTGITKCYNDDTEEIPCPSPGEEFYGQDGNYSINPMSYTKLDENGNELQVTAISWAMVHDNVTGLLWELKNSKDGVEDYTNPHDADNRYTWYDSNPTTNGGYSGTTVNGKDTENFIKILNDANFGGYSDWRLPTIKELYTIIDYSIPYPKPTINTDYFKDYFNCTVACDYWSSSTNAGDINCAWAFDFLNGKSKEFYSKINDHHVMAVRAGQSVSVSSNNFIINGNGTVTDSATGLMWQQDTSNYMTWKDALSFCQNLNLGGYTDWRLPTIKELMTIVDYSRYSPAIDTNIFDNVSDSFLCYFSNSPYADSGAAWAVCFDYGLNELHASHCGSYSYVRAVRGGQ